MSMPTLLSQAPSQPDEPVFPLTLEGYHALVDAGVYTEDDPVEFLEGWLVPKMPRKPSHSSATRILRELIRQLLPAEYFADSQDAVTTTDSEPEPDVYVVRGRMSDFTARHPTHAQTPLVAEVADTTLARDRGMKLRIYARAGIPVYWIVNLVDGCVEVRWQPSGPSKSPKYAELATYHPGDEIPVVIEGKQIGLIPVAAILGQAD
jgi:Uma2 family endonuclease